MASLPSTKFCIQLDCVGMASLPHPRSFLHTIRLRGYGKDAIPSYKKAPAEHLQELFCILICPLQSFGYVLYSLSSTSLMRSSMWLL